MRKPNLVRDVTPNRAGLKGVRIHGGEKATKEAVSGFEVVVVMMNHCFLQTA